MQWRLVSTLSLLTDAWLLLEKVHRFAPSGVLSLQGLVHPFLLIASRKDTRAVPITNTDPQKYNTPPLCVSGVHVANNVGVQVTEKERLKSPTYNGCHSFITWTVFSSEYLHFR